MDDFLVDAKFPGYVYIGNASGNFETDQVNMVDGRPVKVKRPYFNMYVICPVSAYVSEDYRGFGFKAEKYKCLSADVWKDLSVGDKVQLFFDDRKRVQLATTIA